MFRVTCVSCSELCLSARRDGASVLWSGSRRTGEAVRQARHARREAESRRERGSQHIWIASSKWTRRGGEHLKLRLPASRKTGWLQRERDAANAWWVICAHTGAFLVLNRFVHPKSLNMQLCRRRSPSTPTHLPLGCCSIGCSRAPESSDNCPFGVECCARRWVRKLLWVGLERGHFHVLART